MGQVNQENGMKDRRQEKLGVYTKESPMMVCPITAKAEKLTPVSATMHRRIWPKGWQNGRKGING